MAEAKVMFHSSIVVRGEKTIYFDPFKISEATNDADIICITHDHFDHFSPEDIAKVIKSDTIIVAPFSLEEKASKLGGGRFIAVAPDQTIDADGIKIEAVAAYNRGKQFHQKSSGWLGYIVTVDGTRYYVAGDTDRNPDNERVTCDVAFIPIGGKFTMDAKEAADFVNVIKPRKVIPTHYGEVAGIPEDGDIFASLVDPKIEVEIQLEFE